MLTKTIHAVLFSLLLLSPTSKVISQTVDMVGPPGSIAYGTNVTVLANGNYVVTDPYYSEGGVDSIGAVYFV